MFDVIVFLFESYFTFDQNMELNEQEIENELIEEGFNQQDIVRAIAWVSNLQHIYEKSPEETMTAPQMASSRIYTSNESLHIGKENQGFILYLEQAKILTPITRELVIDCVMALDVIDLDEFDFQWIVLMVLFNDPSDNQPFIELESILFSVDSGILH